MKTIGLIGCGNWGKNILRDLITLNCKVYVVDIDSHAKSRALTSGALDVFSKIDDLPDCDGYVVAVPIPDLTRVSADLLRYKKPIFSEKTLCMSFEDVTLLRNLGGSDYIYPMYKWCYHPGIAALRLVAQSGKIGKIEELYTIRHAWLNNFSGGDVFWTQTVHDLTIIKYILGYIPNMIKAVNVIKNEEDLPVSLIAMLGDNPTVSISTSSRHSHKISGVSIHGKQGSAELYNAYDNYITIRNEEGDEKLPIPNTPPLYLQLKEFVEYLLGGPKPRYDFSSVEEITKTIINLRNYANIDHR